MQKKILIGLLLCIISFSAFAKNQQDINKENVIAFYHIALNEKDYTHAEKYLGEQYIQHNPLAEDGKVGFKRYLEYLKENFPHSHSEIKRTFTEGDYVILHVHSILVPDTKGRAIVDIFRLSGGKIVEHWDVIQPIPEKSANENGMF